jgi:predicted membrane-bound mannosyltransferase
MTSLAEVWQRTKGAEILSTSRIPLAVTFLLGTILIFWNLGGDALIHWDEGRTAERAREILVFYDWITIHLNYQPDFAKPPLYYWLTALLYQLIGVNEFTARFWAALFGVLGLYAVYRLGTLLFSVAVGTVAAALLLTVTFYLEYARAAMLDTGLVFYGRRPVQWIWRPEELGPVVQQGSLLIVGKADLLSGLVVQQDITSRVLYQGATYTLMVLSQTPRSTASATACDRAGSIPLPARR